MHGCTMENVTYFLQHTGLSKPQATHNNSGQFESFEKMLLMLNCIYLDLDNKSMCSNLLFYKYDI